MGDIFYKIFSPWMDLCEKYYLSRYWPALLLIIALTFFLKNITKSDKISKQSKWFIIIFLIIVLFDQICILILR